MSAASGGPEWWIASDGRWYPPELHPSRAAPGGPPVQPDPAGGTAPGWWVASDGRWYPPELHPAVRHAPPRPPTSSPSPTAGPFAHHFARGSLKLAGVGSRGLGWVFDLVIFGGLTYLAALFVLAIVPGHPFGAAVLVVAVLSFWYHGWRVAQRGRTPGMGLLGLNVAEAATGLYPVSLGRALARALVATGFALIPFGIAVDLLWAVPDGHNQTLHDKVAGTVVTVSGI